MEKNNSLPLYHIDEVQYPFIEGSFIGKEGKIEKGFFLIDTGSTGNVFNFRAEFLLDEKCYDSEKKSLSAIDNIGEDCAMVNLDIQVGSIESKEVFCIAQNLDLRQRFGKSRIFGILGVSFLLKHQLTLDFEEKCLKPSTIGPICMEDKPFFFPMNFGINNYGIPIVGLYKNDLVYVFIADTGSDLNIVAQDALEKGTHHFLKTQGKRTINGLFGEMEADLAEAEISIISSNKGEGTKEIPTIKDSTLFQVLRGKKYIAKADGDGVPTIDGVLGNEYMLQKQWILDFGNHVIYSRYEYQRD